jgi:RNA polymerase sigma-70 factor (ECF subfamily)
MTPAVPTALLERLDDDALVAHVRRGSEPAFAEIDRRYRRRLVAAARPLLLGTPHDPEDAAQDVLIRVHRFLLREPARPVVLGAWLRVVLRNRCLDLRRERCAWAADLEDRPALGGEPPVVLAERDALRAVLADVARLPERQRTALVARAFEGASHAQLAARLQTSPSAVKSLLGRARSALAPCGVVPAA